VIDRVVLRGRSQTSGARRFELRFSSSEAPAEDFVSVLSGEIPQDNDGHTFTLAPTQARRAELRILDNWGHPSVTDLYNLELWTRDRQGGIVSLAAGGAAVASFSSERQDPERALDIDPGTRWESASGQGTDQWLTVDLVGDDAHLVDRVRLVGPSIGSSPRAFEVRVSESSADPATMTTVYSGEQPGGGQPHWVFFDPTPARFVQLFVHDTQSDIGWVGVSSFDVYSPDLGSPAVPFDDHSADPDGTIAAWSWDFGDGSTSSERHPVHTFSAPGTYSVSLTVTDNDGQSSTLVRDYTAFAPPEALFDWTPIEPLEGDLVRFDDLSVTDGQILAWRWTFHTGAERTADDPAWAYADDGAWPLTLEVTDSRLLTSSVTLDVPVSNADPGLVLIAPTESVVWGEAWIPAQASATDPGSVDQGQLVCRWDYGDGESVTIDGCYGTDARVEHTYAQPGLYTATLTVTDPSGATASGDFQMDVGRRPSRATLLSHVENPAAQELTLEARLLDVFEEPVVGRTVTLRRGGQSVDAVTDAAGEAVGVIASVPEASDPPVVEFAGDALYLPDTGSTYPTGTVLAGIGDGEVFAYDPAGQLVDVLDTASQSIEQSGMCFDPDERLLTANFATVGGGGTYGSMSRFDRYGNRLDALWTDIFNADHPESCAVDANGFVYVRSGVDGPD
ncbi:MAG: PKD domain-containing protein, partial [Acidobacteriota bacterium]